MVLKKKVKKDVAWDHCKSLETRLHVKCNYCPKTIWGGAFRMKHHLAGTHKEVAPCNQAPEEVKNLFKKILEDANKAEDDVIESFDDKATQENDEGNQDEHDSQKKGTMSSFLKKKGEAALRLI